MVSAEAAGGAVLEKHYQRALFQKLELVRNQDHDLVFESLSNTLVENILGYFGVDCTQWVVKQNDVSIRVDGPGETDPRLLPTRNVDPSLANLGVRAVAKNLQIAGELRSLDRLLELLRIKSLTKQGVLLDSARKDKRLLLNVGERALNGFFASLQDSFIHDREQ